ncbi:hypothetical protein DFP74_2332 [Nocardiopsis sp. Huas11]|uniref:hypothetical protein n=1 Tax=Nocardiopsis sp. Huas11 TaxID=2183912 RepID=UPI000EB2267A|nr:hypothetical protein [Nocardiopsis sp. Huas11]RKS06689.1 hypothetical protein DFP74_2332 [Nocardiopsis sp. Huas11]
MIRSPKNLVATYGDEDEDTTVLPVIAFNDEGYAMVFNPIQGRLIVALDYEPDDLPFVGFEFTTPGE